MYNATIILVTPTIKTRKLRCSFFFRLGGRGIIPRVLRVLDFSSRWGLWFGNFSCEKNLTDRSFDWTKYLSVRVWWRKHWFSYHELTLVPLVQSKSLYHLSFARPPKFSGVLMNMLVSSVLYVHKMDATLKCWEFNICKHTVLFWHYSFHACIYKTNESTFLYTNTVI